MTRGWHRESHRHSLSARGIKTSRKLRARGVSSNPVSRLISEWFRSEEKECGTLHPYVVNCGRCEDLSCFVERNLPESEAFWIEDRYEDLGDMSHSVIEYEGRFYDAEAPDGVDDIYDLPVVKNRLNIKYHIKMHRLHDPYKLGDR